MGKIGRIYIKKDQDVTQAEQDFKSFRQEKLNQLTPEERKVIEKGLDRIIDEIKADHPSVIFSQDMLLEAILTAQYISKFGESPTQTRLKTLAKGQGNENLLV